MKQTINCHQFRQSFIELERTNFSWLGLAVLFDYLEEYENDTGEELELDPIALCCEYSEEKPEVIAEYYNIDIDGLEDDQVLRVVLDWLYEATTVVGVVGDGETIIYQQC